MKKNIKISTLFLDIGGVLLSNGWGRNMRRKAADTFKLDFDELDERHHMVFYPYEEGKLSIDEYLKLVIFHKKRSFDLNTFKEFLFEQTQPKPEMIKMFKSISKYKHHGYNKTYNKPKSQHQPVKETNKEINDRTPV